MPKYAYSIEFFKSWLRDRYAEYGKVNTFRR